MKIIIRGGKMGAATENAQSHLSHLLNVISSVLGVDSEAVRRPSKNRELAEARGINCHPAIFDFGYSGGEVGRFLHLGSSGPALRPKEERGL